MAVDKNNPRTWIKYKSSLCSTCHATCCTLLVEVNAEDLVRLEIATTNEVEKSPKKVASRLIKQGIVSQYREKTGLFTLTQKSNSDCFYLGSNRMCTVYEKRPSVCRKFPDQRSPRVDFCPYIKKDRP